jgi:hypothetical protein
MCVDRCIEGDRGADFHFMIQHEPVAGTPLSISTSPVAATKRWRPMRAGCP